MPHDPHDELTELQDLLHQAKNDPTPDGRIAESYFRELLTRKRHQLSQTENLDPDSVSPTTAL